MTSIQTRLDEIDSRMKAATPGPWSYDRDEEEIHADSCATSDGEPWHVIPSQTTGFFMAKDAELIAHAPEDLAQLTAALRIALEALEHYTKEVEYTEVDAKIYFHNDECPRGCENEDHILTQKRKTRSFGPFHEPARSREALQAIERVFGGVKG